MRKKCDKQMKYAYIFDFDGVLVNTMEAHYATYKQALQEVAVPIDKKQFYYQAGMTGKEQIAYFADKAGIEIDVEKVYARKKVLWADYADCATSIECNLALLRCLKKAGFPIAIATGSSPGTIIPIMKQFQIEVDAVATAEDVERGKPFPDLFFCAAAKLNLKPEYCTVVEDSDVGVEAARAAGMNVMRFYEKK